MVVSDGTKNIIKIKKIDIKNKQSIKKLQFLFSDINFFLYIKKYIQHTIKGKDLYTDPAEMFPFIIKFSKAKINLSLLIKNKNTEINIIINVFRKFLKCMKR